ncbi:putative secreted protein (Por secretion system target) [Mariniflexile fucanivorans]|uniref:Putative secreted protein (Por secretion system target) n=1 Tax=Mariniflexile fucanivorans TaxID=264023 RepID=A0A4R1RJ42_9FLAO|nr:T9SS type A sorting domain-containing protein [Mariniflexile fucanivorans]TCL66135.1 putative secreted protein (Por secretion system target) [Mariniflexile fucanivorans]
MKTKLLLLALFVTMLGYSQTAIEQFQSATGSQFVRVTGTINQSPTGANASWDFTGLSDTSTIYSDTYSSSTIQTKEGSTLIAEIVLNTSGATSIISEKLEGFELNFSNYGIIGTFPLSYNYSNSDTVSGTFSGGGVSGTVANSSNIVVSVDAYGTLKVGAFDGAVTRLKMVQNLSLNITFPPITASGTLTSYFYYDANSTNLIFRTNHLEVSDAGIDTTIMERLYNNPLSNDKFHISNSDLSLVSNPVQEVLRLNVSNNIKIQRITILDVLGKIVLKVDTNESSIPVNQLKSGLFFASITTDKGVVIKKFIKK